MSDSLGTVVKEALEMRAKMKADGATGDTLNAGLEAVLRDIWPKMRAEPWREVCAQCRDYGLEMYDCPGDETCGRKNPHPRHDYGRPCVACAKGKLFHDKLVPSADDATTIASRPRERRKGPSRWPGN